jgi:PhoPQ-activated pathogenicity-related protein
VAHVAAPASGWTAFFIEMTFPSGGRHPLKITSGVRVRPDALPYAAPAVGTARRSVAR